MAAWEERLNTELNDWRKVSEVICDKRVHVKLKGKVHKSVVRPTMTYGLETAPLRKVEENWINIKEYSGIKTAMVWTPAKKKRRSWGITSTESFPMATEADLTFVSKQPMARVVQPFIYI
ncbi:uncharacterized protein LOC119595567 [Penaeus monodon]|uniref:uncharacterized protein LOC119595567 n=1 Tax=Penaeus monodon TaxID=6687 RepID=UPI0018A72256|nr:uncharacterized protein LOC119595567 [Penaeus monodon]